MPPRPDPNAAPEPWSDADFLPVEAVLRARPHGGTPSRQRLGLIRSRLQARLRARGIPSFTWFHDRHLHARGDGAGMARQSAAHQPNSYRRCVPLAGLEPATVGLEVRCSIR